MSTISRASRFATAAVVAVTAVSVGLIGTAAAAPPDHASGGQPETLTFVENERFVITECGFPVEIVVDLVHEFSYHFDQRGLQTFGMHRSHGTYTFTNLDSGYTLVSRDASLARAYDFVHDLTYDGAGLPSGTVSWTRSNQGNSLPLNVPGSGRVLGDVGRLTFHISVELDHGVAGPRQTELLSVKGQWSFWGLEDACPFLAAG